MSIKQIKKAEWQANFNLITKEAATKYMKLEITSLTIGDQVLSENVPLYSMYYDDKLNIIEIAAGDISHTILQPTNVYFDEGSNGLNLIEILDINNTKHIIQLREPFKLTYGVV